MALPIATAEEMGRVDTRAIESFGIPSAALMETAGGRAAQIIWERFGKPGLRVLVLAGKGNNGGDGFVIARHLLNRGAAVRVMAIFPLEEASGDSAIFLSILKKMDIGIEEAGGEEGISALASAARHCDLVVDALLGTGFAPPARGFIGEALSALSGVRTPIAAVDIPSGLDATSGAAEPPFLSAELTVTFGALKRGHYLMPAAGYAGEVRLIDIGIPRACLDEENISLRLIERSDVAGFLPIRRVDAHKGDAGHLLVLAGSKGMMGAALLAASAGLRMGAGKVTLAVPESLTFAVESGPPEIMALSLPETSAGTADQAAFDLILESALGMDALVLGPGMSTHPRTVELIHRLIQHIEIPLVLDADGLNALSQDITVLDGTRQGLVLTPHPGEMARLGRISTAEVQADRVNLAIDFAVRYKVHLALKGAHTITALPDGAAWLNPTGNSALASGGTGDVLAGAVGGLLAQGVSPEGALTAGTYLHGLAGDIVAGEGGDTGLAATDLLPALPLARRRVLQEEREERH
ncbi:MAG TPA: bifunctional ADP-dependent NAD(P)H-hydrate dehydratase/NAD(P)H-hydrate epimerase [Nitrospinae bacterium]|nr:bifunctional ADP-dependent NAD(P)H-hydrate dehydratase/NAD(P)H-hydrate epimerase [Nitrospinota bacterium]